MSCTVSASRRRSLRHPLRDRSAIERSLVVAALVACALVACRREAAPASTPPVTVAGTDSAFSVEAPSTSDNASSERAFIVLVDTILPRPTEETPVVELDFYDSLSISLNDTEPIAEDGSIPSPPDTEPVPGKILTTGSFHGAEVPEDAGQHEWLGAFIDSGACRLQPTRIEIQSVPDPAGGGEEDTSGKEVTTKVEGRTDFLVRDIETLEAGPCEAMESAEKGFGPGSRFKFRYLDVEYMIAATSHPSSRIIDEHGIRTHVFRLFLTRRAPGGDSTAVILRWLRGEGITILRLGDFDRDGLPDFLMNDAGDYNAAATSLYLSRPAAPGRMLKPVGSFVVTGC